MKCVLVVSLILFSTMALAHNCPNEMKAIDAKLATKPKLPGDTVSQTRFLRSDGETYHKTGKHDDAMKALVEAKKLLGI